VISEDTINALLAGKSEAELLAIREQTELVVLGHSTSIQSLGGQNIVWDKQSADVTMRLVLHAISRKRAGTDEVGTPAVMLRPTLGHSVRFPGLLLAP
jgi:hypothetical protein